MSNYEVCRDCEHFGVEDTVLCRDCAENGFIDLMNTNATARLECYTGEYYYSNVAEIDKFTDDIFQCWFNNDAEKAGKLIFKLFNAKLEQFQQDGEL